MSTFSNLRSQGGQAVTEAVLILVLLFGVTFMIANYFKNEELLRQLVQGPWRNLSGMLQNGVWAAPNVGATSHPNAHGRHIVIQGERVR